jgi:hypothetical protein
MVTRNGWWERIEEGRWEGRRARGSFVEGLVLQLAGGWFSYKAARPSLELSMTAV